MIFKKLYKTVTESNNVKFVWRRNERQVRLYMYQLVGSELFTIKEIKELVLEVYNKKY